MVAGTFGVGSRDWQLMVWVSFGNLEHTLKIDFGDGQTSLWLSKTVSRLYVVSELLLSVIMKKISPHFSGKSFRVPLGNQSSINCQVFNSPWFVWGQGCLASFNDEYNLEKFGDMTGATKPELYFSLTLCIACFMSVKNVYFLRCWLVRYPIRNNRVLTALIV